VRGRWGSRLCGFNAEEVFPGGELERRQGAGLQAQVGHLNPARSRRGGVGVERLEELPYWMPAVRRPGIRTRADLGLSRRSEPGMAVQRIAAVGLFTWPSPAGTLGRSSPVLRTLPRPWCMTTVVETHARLIECVPNFSRAAAASGRGADSRPSRDPGVILSTTKMDADHNGPFGALTFAAEPEPVMEAAFRGWLSGRAS